MTHVIQRQCMAGRWTLAKHETADQTDKDEGKRTFRGRHVQGLLKVDQDSITAGPSGDNTFDFVEPVLPDFNLGQIQVADFGEDVVHRRVVSVRENEGSRLREGK